MYLASLWGSRLGSSNPEGTVSGLSKHKVKMPPNCNLNYKLKSSELVSSKSQKLKTTHWTVSRMAQTVSQTRAGGPLKTCKCRFSGPTQGPCLWGHWVRGQSPRGGGWHPCVREPKELLACLPPVMTQEVSPWPTLTLPTLWLWTLSVHYCER